MLQWVHSLVAVVMRGRTPTQTADTRASMGPQSGSCGYSDGSGNLQEPLAPQWVHSLVAVVIPPCPDSCRACWTGFNGSTVW